MGSAHKARETRLHEATCVRGLPAGSATKTGTAPPARSRTAARSASLTVSASVAMAAASRPRAPDETAWATARASAEICNDGRLTVAAVYVRPSKSRTAAPSAARVRARDAFDNVISLASSGMRSMVQRYRTGLRLQQTHHDVRHAIAPTGRCFGLKAKTLN